MFKKLDEAPGKLSKFKGKKKSGPSGWGSKVPEKYKSKSPKSALHPSLQKPLNNNKIKEETMNDSVRNIITSAMENNSIEVQSAIHTAIGEKIKDALEAKRVVVAQNLVGIGEAKEVKCPTCGAMNCTKHGK